MMRPAHRGLPAAWLPVGILLLVAPWFGGGTSATHHLALDLLVAAAVVLAWRRDPPQGRPPAAILLAVVCAAWWSLGTLRSAYLFGSFTRTWELLLAVGVLWAAHRLATPGTARAGANLVLGLTLVQGVWALLQAADPSPLRGAAGFLNPNHLAAYLNLGIGLAAGLLVERRGRHPWAVAVAALALAAQFVAVSSRGALLALAVVGSMALLRLRRPAARRVAAAGMLLLLALAGWSVARRFAGPEDVYRHDRLRIWPAVLQAAVEHPVAGLGPGMLPHLAERYNFPRDEGPVRYGRRFRGAHSEYLELLAETGGVGLTLFLGFGVALLAGVARCPAGPLQAGWGDRAGAVAALALVAVHGAVDNVLASPAVTLTAAALAGAALRHRPSRLGRRRPLAPATALAAAGVGAVVLYATVISPWRGQVHFLRMDAAVDSSTFRRELTAALRHNPLQPYYYDRAARALLRSIPRLDPASYALCYHYAATSVRLFDADPRLHLRWAEVCRRGWWEAVRDGASAEEAVIHYRRAVDLAPTDPIPAAALAGHLLDMRRDEEALQAAQAALEIEPEFVDARRMRIEAFRRLGRAREARAEETQLEARAEILRGYQPTSEYEAIILGRGARGAGGD